MIRKEHIHMLALILLWMASGLTMLTITRRALWFDESWTWHVAWMSLGEGLQATARDRHPPLHTLLYHLWVRVAGDSELSLRWPSMAFGLLAMATAGQLHRRVWGTSWAGNLAIALTFLSPLWLEQMRQARMYTQLAFCVLISWWLMECFLERPALSRWFVWTLAGVALLFTHYYGVFPLAVESALLLAMRPNWRSLGWTAGRLAIIGLGMAMWMSIGGIRPGLFLPETSPPGLSRILSITVLALQSWVDAHWGKWSFMGFTMLVVSFLTSLLPPIRPVQRRWLLFTAGAIALPLLIMTGARGNLLNFAPRHILYAHPLVSIGIAGGLVQLHQWVAQRASERIRAAALLAIWMTGSAAAGGAFHNALALLQSEARAVRPEEEIVRDLRKRSAPGDLVLSIRAHWGIRYYWRRWQPLAELLEGPQAPIFSLTDPERYLRISLRSCPAFRRVWIVGWQEEFVDPMGLFPMWLLWNGFEESSQDIHGLSVRGYLVPCALEPPSAPWRISPVIFQNGVNLLGAQFRPPHPSDRLLGVALTWSRERPIQGPVKVFIHVHRATGELIAQEDFFLARGFTDIARWPQGQPMTVFAAVRLPERLKPDIYSVRIGLYDPETLMRISIQQPIPGLDAWLLATFPMEALTPMRPWKPLPVRAAVWQDGITLNAVWIQPDQTACPGETVEALTLWGYHEGSGWVAPYVAFVHLWDRAGRLIAQEDHPILEPSDLTAYRSGGGTTVISRFRFVIPHDISPGSYRLVIGRYHWPSLRRIPIGVEDHVELGSIEVRRCP